MFLSILIKNKIQLIRSISSSVILLIIYGVIFFLLYQVIKNVTTTYSIKSSILNNISALVIFSIFIIFIFSYKYFFVCNLKNKYIFLIYNFLVSSPLIILLLLYNL